MRTNTCAPAVEAAAAIRRGEVTASELTADVLDRIGADDPSVHAIVELRSDLAMKEAAAADDAVRRGASVGPLHGVPITIKDAFQVAGMHTTWGVEAFADRVADRDATVVARLRSAGAIVVGSTNVAAMLADFGQTANPVYGVTANPWDLSRAAGGSSGGSAAAVAAGLSYLDYGTDLVGSIRIPAAFCGVYGLRPTPDTVPLTGFQPPGTIAPPSEMTYVSAIGPIARSAADLRVALQATAGPEGTSAYSWALPAPRCDRLADFRVGVVLDDPRAPVTADVGDRMSDVIDALAARGVAVRDGWPEGVDPGRVAETFGAHVEMFLGYLDPGPPASVFANFVAHERARMAVRQAWAHYFGSAADVFLCPTAFTTAIAHDARPFADRTIATAAGDRAYDDLAFWVAHPALPGLPVVAAPIGLSGQGLPVGMQVVGPRFEDDTALTFAELLADVVGGYRPPPGIDGGVA